MQKISREKYDAFKEVYDTLIIMGENATQSDMKTELEVRLAYPVNDKTDVELNLEKAIELTNKLRDMNAENEKFIKTVKAIPQLCEDTQEAILKHTDYCKSFQFLTK